jgi:hypothetical protein
MEEELKTMSFGGSFQRDPNYMTNGSSNSKLVKKSIKEVASQLGSLQDFLKTRGEAP